MRFDAVLRRTCARLRHGAGGELEQIQFLLGHASVQMTERYTGCRQKFKEAVNDPKSRSPRPRDNPVYRSLYGSASASVLSPLVREDFTSMCQRPSSPNREHLNAHSAASRNGLPYRCLSFEDRLASDKTLPRYSVRAFLYSAMIRGFSPGPASA
jgi:hypothetical protein